MTEPKVDAVFCARGGFGSMQILKLLDYQKLRQSRKLFIGFSDITAMQWAIYSKCGLPTVSAGMVATDMAHMEIDKEFESKFLETDTFRTKLPIHWIRQIQEGC